MRKFHFPKEKIEQALIRGYKFTHIVKSNVTEAVALVFQDEYKNVITVTEQTLSTNRAKLAFAQCKYNNVQPNRRVDVDDEFNKIASAIKRTADIKKEVGRGC